MSNGGSGNYETTDDLMWKAFDKLPFSVRQRLTQSNEKWVPQPLVTLMRRCEKQNFPPSEVEKALIERIDYWDNHEKQSHFHRMDRLAEKNIDYWKPVRVKRK